MKHIMYIPLILIIACKNNDEHNKNKVVKDSIISKNEKPIKSIKEESVLYYIENDSIKQQVDIIILEHKISFKLISENKTSKISNILEGEAELSNSTDMEFEEDSEGNAIPVDEYIYKNQDCWISFKIESENQSFVKLKEADCNIFSNSNNLNTDSFLKRKKSTAQSASPDVYGK